MDRTHSGSDSKISHEINITAAKSRKRSIAVKNCQIVVKELLEDAFSHCYYKPNSSHNNHNNNGNNYGQHPMQNIHNNHHHSNHHSSHHHQHNNRKEDDNDEASTRVKYTQSIR